FVVFTVAVLGSPSGSSSDPKVVSAVVLAVQAVLLILTVLLFRAGVMTFTCSLFFAGFVIFVVVTYVVLLQADSSSAQSAAVLAVIAFPTILAILSGLLILFRADYLTFTCSLFCVGFVIFVVVTYVVLLQAGGSSAQSAAIFAAVMFPTFLAILSGAWALLLIFAVLVFLTILLFQAGHGTAAFFLFLMGIVTVVFTSASSGVSKNPPTFENFKLGVQGAWAPIVMAVVAMAFEFLGKGDESKLKELINALVDGTGGLKELGSADKVTEALGKSGLSEKHKNVYANAFKVVFNKVRTYDPELDSDQKLKDSAKEKIKGKIENVFTQDTGLNDLSSDQKKEFKSECAQAYFNSYNTAVDVDSDSAVKSELNSALTKASTTEAQIKSALGNSPKISLLSAVQVDAYAKAAKGGSSKKAGRRAVGVVAAAELAGCIACAGPGDAPILVRNGIVSSSNTVKFESKHDDAAGDVMTFGIFWNNLFSVYFLYLMDAHLSNFFMYTGKLAEGH
ncbi:uncharacterized protein BdWA1_003518, partial [Babesia duncani]